MDCDISPNAEKRWGVLLKTPNIMLISFRCFLLISLRSGSIFVENKIGRYEQNYYNRKWL